MHHRRGLARARDGKDQRGTRRMIDDRLLLISEGERHEIGCAARRYAELPLKQVADVPASIAISLIRAEVADRAAKR